MTSELPKYLTAKDIGLPSRKLIMKFIVEILSEHKDGLSSAEMTKRIIEHFELEPFQVEAMNSSGTTTILKKEIAWARQLGADAGHIEHRKSPRVWVSKK